MEKEQITNLVVKLKASRRPLVVVAKNPDPDALGASLALFLSFKKMNIQPKVACASKISKKYGFLADHDSIKREVEVNSEYCLTIDMANEDINEIKAECIGGSLKLRIRAGSGTLKADSLKFTIPDSVYDLIIAISAPNLDSFGKIYYENKNIFQSVPIININNKSKSDNYGILNVSDNSMTVCEMIYLILSEMDPAVIDFQISTALLSGIISGTKNFQAKTIGYRTFDVTSKLMANGANRSEIIGYLEKSNIPSYVIECYGLIADSIGQVRSLSHALKKIEDFSKKKRLTSQEKAILLTMISFLVFQGARNVNNRQLVDISGNSGIDLTKRDTVHAVETLPISSGAQIAKTEPTAGAQTVGNASNDINPGLSTLSDIAISDPKTLEIPSLNINANIQYVGLSNDGSVGIPSNEKEVAWYKFGARPGDAGNAVIVGHRDSSTNPNGVFRRLNDLKIGDIVQIIDINGNLLKFIVTKKDSYQNDNAPIKEIFGASDKKMLNLITCSGVWDEKGNNYEKRIVIYSELKE